MKIRNLCTILWLTSSIFSGVFSDEDDYKPKAIGRKRSHNVALWSKRNGDDMAAFKMEGLKSILANRKKLALVKTTTRTLSKIKKKSSTFSDSPETLLSSSVSSRSTEDDFLMTICDEAMSSREAPSARKYEDAVSTTVGKLLKQQSLAADNNQTLYTTSAPTTLKKRTTVTKTVGTTSSSPDGDTNSCNPGSSSEAVTYTCSDGSASNKTSATKPSSTTKKNDQINTTSSPKPSTTTTKTKKKIVKDIGDAGHSPKPSGWKKLANFFKNSESQTQKALREERTTTSHNEPDAEEDDTSFIRNESVKENASNDLDVSKTTINNEPIEEENGSYNTAETTLKSVQLNYEPTDFTKNYSKSKNEKHGFQKKQKGSSSHNKHKKENSDIITKRGKSDVDRETASQNNGQEKDMQANQKTTENDGNREYNKMQEKNIENEKAYNNVTQKEKHTLKNSNKNNNIDFSGNESLMYTYDEQRDDGFTGKEKYVYSNDKDRIYPPSKEIQDVNDKVSQGDSGLEPRKPGLLNLDTNSGRSRPFRISSETSKYNIQEPNENILENSHHIKPSSSEINTNQFPGIKNIPNHQYKFLNGNAVYGKDYEGSGSKTENTDNLHQQRNNYRNNPANEEQFTHSDTHEGRFKGNELNGQEIKRTYDNKESDLDSSSSDEYGTTQNTIAIKESDPALTKFEYFRINRKHLLNFKNRRNEEQRGHLRKPSHEFQYSEKNLKDKGADSEEGSIPDEGLLNKEEPNVRQEDEGQNAKSSEDTLSGDEVVSESVGKYSVVYNTQPVPMFTNPLSVTRPNSFLKSITRVLGLNKDDENKNYHIYTAPSSDFKQHSRLNNYQKTNPDKPHDMYRFQDSQKEIATEHFLPVVHSSYSDKYVKGYTTEQLTLAPTNENDVNQNEYTKQVNNSVQNSNIFFATESSTNEPVDITMEGNSDQEILQISDNLSAFTTKPGPFKQWKGFEVATNPENDLNSGKKSLEELRRPSLGLQKLIWFNTSKAPMSGNDQKDLDEVKIDNAPEANTAVDIKKDNFRKESGSENMKINFPMPGLEISTEVGSYSDNTFVSNNKMNNNEMYLSSLNKVSTNLPPANDEFTIPNNFEAYKSKTLISKDQNEATQTHDEEKKIVHLQFEHFTKPAVEVSTLLEDQKMNFQLSPRNRTFSNFLEKETQRNDLYNTAFVTSCKSIAMGSDIPPSVGKNDPEWKSWIPLKVTNIPSPHNQGEPKIEMENTLMTSKFNLSKNSDKNLDNMNSPMTVFTLGNNWFNNGENKNCNEFLAHNYSNESLFSTIKNSDTTKNMNADFGSGPFQNPLLGTPIENIQKIFNLLPNPMFMDKQSFPINTFFNFPNIYNQVAGRGKMPNQTFSRIYQNTNSFFPSLFTNILMSDLLNDSDLNQTWELVPLDDYLESELPLPLNQSPVDFMPMRKAKPKDNGFSVEMSIMKVIHGPTIGRPQGLVNQFQNVNHMSDENAPTEVILDSATKYGIGGNKDSSEMNELKEGIPQLGLENKTMKQYLSEDGSKEGGFQKAEKTPHAPQNQIVTVPIAPGQIVSTKSEGISNDSVKLKMTQEVNNSEMYKLRKSNFNWRNEMQEIINDNYVSQANGELLNEDSDSSNQLSYIVKRNLGHLDLDRSALYKYLTKERVNFIDKQRYPIHSNKRSINKRTAEKKFDKKHKTKELEYILQRNLPSLPLNKKHFINYMMNNLGNTTESSGYERATIYSKNRMQSEIEKNIRKPQQKLSQEQKFKRPWGRNPQSMQNIP